MSRDYQFTIYIAHTVGGIPLPVPYLSNLRTLPLLGVDAGNNRIPGIGQVRYNNLPVTPARGQLQRIVRTERHGRHGPALVLGGL